MENILVSTEIDLYIENMEPFSIKDIGSRPWFEWHYRLQKLNQQMIVDVSSLKEETVKETLIAMDKIKVLVYEAITISIWKTKVLPLLLKLELNRDCTFLLYAVLFHEATCVALMESVLFHMDGCQMLKDSAVDLIDYACNNIAQLFVNEATIDSSEDIPGQRESLNFDIGIRCLSIIRYLTENLNEIEVSASIRLYKTHDVPMMLAQLISVAPWKKEGKFFTDGRWKDQHQGGPMKVCQAETQCWLAIRSLLSNPLCSQHYEFTSHAKEAFLKLIALMTDDLLDQISPLIEMKRYLTQLSVGAVNENLTVKKGFILEVIPEIQPKIMAECKGKWKEIAQLHAQRFFLDDKQKVMTLATEISSAYNVDLLEKLENIHMDKNGKICGGCGKLAMQKCSRCKTSWYCSRKCQVQDWPHHKENCKAVA